MGNEHEFQYLRGIESGKPPFIKYEHVAPHIPIEDISPFASRELFMFEKVDGGNCQVRHHNWRLFGGSRGNYLEGKPRIQRVPWFSKFLRWMYSNDSLHNLPTNLVVFGEWSGNHTIQYSPKHTDQFFMIDVLDTDKGRFIDYESARSLLKKLGIEDVRYLDILEKGPNILQPDVEQLLQEPSKYRNGPKEGLVAKDYDCVPQTVYKIYHPDFAETRRYGGGVDCLTPMRFRKNLHALIENRQDIPPRFSEDEIICRVVRDVRGEGTTIREDAVRHRLRKYLRSNTLGDLGNLIVRRNV